MFAILNLYVTPNARDNEITGWTQDNKGRPLLNIKIRSPQVATDKANKELLKFLAKSWGIKKKDMSLVSGEKRRAKRLKIKSDQPIPLLVGLLS